MSNNHKNIQFGIKDMQAAKVVHTCSVTNGEIYEGEVYVEVDGNPIKDDYETLIEYVNGVRRVAGDEDGK